MRTSLRTRGQAAILISMSLVVTLGTLGLVVDVGWAYWRREAAATAADSAALAAARYAAANFSSYTSCPTGLTCSSSGTACSATPTSPPTSTFGAGCLYAKQNGFLNSGNQTVSMAGNITSSPVTGVSPAYWVSATASEKIPTTFSAVLGQTASNVSVKAVAGVFGGSASGCFYIMGTTNTDLSISGGSLSTNCGIFINSTGPNAILQSGGTVTASGGAQVYNRDGYTHSGGSITPAPVAGSAVTDPFASLTAPSTTGSCVDSGLSLSSGSATLQSGKHCGAVSISGGTLTIDAGTHIFENGLNVSGGTVQDTGGVTLYMDSGGLSMSGATVNLSAPTSNPYNGILIFYNRTNSASINLSGGSLALTGAVYALDSTFNLSGGTYTNVTFVINNVNASGGGSSTVNGSANTSYTSSGGTTVSLIQ